MFKFLGHTWYSRAVVVLSIIAVVVASVGTTIPPLSGMGWDDLGGMDGQSLT